MAGRAAFLLAAALLLALVPGCQTARVTQPLPARWADNDPHARSEFWFQLAARPVAGNDEAFHGLLLYLDGADAAPDYPSRVRQLQARGMLPADFRGAADEALDRGTLAVGLVKVLNIRGGLTMRLLGPSPRYAVRALECRGVYPPSSPNQGLSGGELVGILQKAEEFEHGNPADAPASHLPSEILRAGAPLAALRGTRGSSPPAAAEATALPPIAFCIMPALTPEFGLTAPPASPDADEDAADEGSLTQPLLLADAPEPPATAPNDLVRKLNVIVTGVEGDAAELRKSAGEPWIRARVGMVLHENAEFRTGLKSAVRFIIPPDQTFCLDSLGTTRVAEAAAKGKKIETDIELSHGRVRYDVAPLAPGVATGEPVRIEQAGIEHDAAIRSPNSALALRGTKVSLFDQPEFDPEAISLTGRAIYVNTQGRRVPFGGRQRAVVSGSQNGAAQAALAQTTALQSVHTAQADFNNREVSVVIQRGGFVSGDVVVGNLHLSDFKKLPGSLDFVLQWSGGPAAALNDLNLAVFSPLNTRTSPDFVANPPFTISLTPGNPASEQTRATSYPRTSPSGGAISKNSVGPDGLELASWPKSYPAGTYRVVVFNFLDAKPPPTTVTNPVTYTIDVFLNGRKLISTFTGSVGFLQTSPALAVAVPPAAGTPAAQPARPPASIATRSHATQIAPAIRAPRRP